MPYTFAELQISRGAFDEIADKLQAGSFDRPFIGDAIDMHGIGLTPPPADCHGLDTPERVCFYEQDFYVLSNFSAFNLRKWGQVFPTSEHAYQWYKFHHYPQLQREILSAPSAHDAFKLAEANRDSCLAGWHKSRVGVMEQILRAKVEQHEYVRRKLLATGNRELVENSWRDAFWGWGPNRDGQNMLGKLWMEIRAELRANPISED